MGEALINHLGAGRYSAFSAGSRPAGYVHLKAISTLRKHGIDPGKPRSKSWDLFADEKFDLVITVCHQAANEICPVFPGSPEKLHWSIPDPAGGFLDRSEAQENDAFEKTYQLLKTRIERELL
jgi:arsenate reductase